MRASWLFHGDPVCSVRWRRGPPDGSPVVVFDAKQPFLQASELERSEVYVPQPIADFFEPHVFAGQRMRDADPMLLPPDAAVAAHEADLKMTGVFEGRELPRQRPRRRVIVRGGRLLV